MPASYGSTTRPRVRYLRDLRQSEDRGDAEAAARVAAEALVEQAPQATPPAAIRITNGGPGRNVAPAHSLWIPTHAGMTEQCQ